MTIRDLISELPTKGSSIWKHTGDHFNDCSGSLFSFLPWDRDEEPFNVVLISTSGVHALVLCHFKRRFLYFLSRFIYFFFLIITSLTILFQECRRCQSQLEVFKFTASFGKRQLHKTNHQLKWPDIKWGNWRQSALLTGTLAQWVRRINNTFDVCVHICAHLCVCRRMWSQVAGHAPLYMYMWLGMLLCVRTCG